MDANQLYFRALQGAAFHLPRQAGLLRLSGRDRISFIQRQSTNNLLTLAPQTALLSVLTSATARILDVLHLFPGGESEPEILYALTLPGKAASTTAFLKSRIFFMDQVQIEDLSQSYTQIELDGPAAAAILRQCGALESPAPGAWRTSLIAGMEVWLIARPGWGGVGYNCVASASARQSIEQALQNAGALPLDDATAGLLRLEAGLPGPLEQSEAYTPLEAGLEKAVSGNKGCYTGQEILARQITYDKVTRKLAGLRLRSPAQPGAEIQAEGRTIGEVTSSAISPSLGPIALAILKRPYFEPGSQVHVAGQPAEVCALPFQRQKSPPIHDA